jgi:hypothetical protein
LFVAGKLEHSASAAGDVTFVAIAETVPDMGFLGLIRLQNRGKSHGTRTST